MMLPKRINFFDEYGKVAVMNEQALVLSARSALIIILMRSIRNKAGNRSPLPCCVFQNITMQPVG
jgi:hypothetical protein